ncbi:MAG: hypothetical protein LBT84_03120, partial [Spirochaetia bacterium]|nr:hypothetical protein [Spirochaetia bacterium]
MDEFFQKLYSLNSYPDSAFLLEEGSVFFHPNNSGDNYSIRGERLIVGATELVMRHILNSNADRGETATAGAHSVLKRIPVERFMDGMKTFPFLLNAAAVMAKQTALTNEIIDKFQNNSS